jgi:glyoxylase-like metal-dependent hydrolase (beta-lactamase superfamily II)
VSIEIHTIHVPMPLRLGNVNCYLISSGGVFLFCGDLLMNDKVQPSLGFGDPAAFVQTIQRPRGLHIRTIYPGHGKAFDMTLDISNRLGQ